MTESEEMQELVSPAEEPDGNAMWRGLPARLRQATRHLWTQRPYLTIGFAIFLVVNVALVAGYLWSRGGQTVHVRVEADGDQFTAYIDGKLHAEGEFDAPSQGGIMLILADTQSLPSLPEPRGIDSVRVTDLDTNEVLFEDDFSSGYGPEWQASGAFSSKNGVLGVTGRGVLDLLDAPWRNYAVDVKYKNIEGSTIILRAQDGRTDVTYNFRPFRDLDNRLTYREEGQVVSHAPGRRIELSKSETIRSLVAMTLNPYPLVLLLLALGFLAVVALQFTGVLRAPRALASVSPNLAWYVAAVITGGAFAVTLFLNYSYGSRLPHVPDSVSYIFQAKLLASGRLAAPPPPVEEVFDFFFPPFIFLSGDKWASIYPFGHPLMLAIGARLGAIWLIPPLLGAASVALVFAIGRKIYSARVGLLAALLLATSPFFLMTASNFMAHNTAVFYLLGSLLFLAIIDRRPFLFGLLAGLFFGLVFNTR
ncbi:MAG: glycosyltransferase family 39 protein, partial [Chloroflexi bacterium]|nr:glycosyltransferase family 39 protein [Chloroflexota bacterium]